MIEAARQSDTSRENRPVLLFVSDPAVLASLQFSLRLDGFTPASGLAEGADPQDAACLVIDQRYRSDGLAFLDKLRAAGAMAPAVLLATHPTRAQHTRAETLDAWIVEKPLLGDDLTRALATILGQAR